MTRYRVTLTTYVTATDDSAAAEHARGLAGSCFAVVGVEPDEVSTAAFDKARQLAATGMDRWRDQGKHGLTAVTSFEVLELLHAFLVLANSRGRA
jgi:hypothetical protein